MLFHKYPLGRTEHLTQLTKLSGVASDISRTTSGLSDAARASTKTAGLSDIRRVGGLDDLSITPPKSAYTSLPAGPQRRIAAGNEFSSRNITQSSKTSPTESLASMQERLQLKKDVRDTATILGDQKKVDLLTKQIDELDLDVNMELGKLILKGYDEDPTGATLRNNLTPSGQSKFKSATDKLMDDMKKPEWKNRTSQEKWEDVRNFGKKNAALLGMTTLTVMLSAFYIKSQVDSNRINDTDYKIKKITSSEDTITVTYEPEDRFTKNDIITITDSNSTPKIDGDIQPIFTGQGVIRFKGNKLTTFGDSGKLSVYTSVEDQFSQTVSEATKPVTQAAGQTAGAVVGGTLGGLYEGLVPSNIRNFFSEYWIVALIICIIFCISSSLSVILAYAK